VLVVEDEAPVRRALRRMLERAGYRVLEAEDGAAAVERFGATDIDLLLTDLIMPGTMTGLDVAGQFRSRAASLPVLYMSGYGADLLTGDGRAPDGTVLAKPFSEDALLGAVRAAVEAP
jgi:CheY-like chemotaxis protein